ncbi:protein SENSITIVITY TO RED LIGHT REDUCED 1 [Dendrobium catenatum]|uniref:Protein SENSITIVITY TO RED LIGHT REDUCED 1 n=1 Tax=Dendrobium catenatum TaxID=906689 RepID=A0A2I0VHX8_9ASPA|nr:protein SENSITIVITY TO RED LIGHT REDUCED 1 [Dendrobium catenatum]PKU63025.1 Protein SENSITIVITY TO RED LIGHT REDUCED 1 [Dendrobium catenatum]
MTPTTAETLNSNPNETWTLVTRRRGKHITNPAYRSKTPTQSSKFGTPSSWTPTDSSSDPPRESKLLRQMQSAIRQLETSQFVSRFLSRLRDPKIQEGFNKLLASGSPIQIVAYGIGSIESYKVPRLQLALALLLKKELGVRAAGPIEVFDPVLSAVECAVLEALGCRLIVVDECGRRETAVPTIFYMPHCEAALYDNLLDANWKPMMLRKMVVLGNSFGVYERYVSEMRGVCGSVSLEVDGRHLLGIRRYVREMEMEERDSDRDIKEDEEEDLFYKAFHDMSWHFFELDDAADMELLCK